MSSSKKQPPEIHQVAEAARTVEAVQNELDDALEVLKSQVNSAVQEGVDVEEIAALLDVTVTEVDKMIAADRERAREWREEQGGDS